MFKSGGSAKTVFSLLLFTQLCRTGNFCFGQFVYYGVSSLAERSRYPYQIANVLHLDDDGKIIVKASHVKQGIEPVTCPEM